MAATLIVVEKGPQLLEKVVWQRYFVTDCRLLDTALSSHESFSNDRSSSENLTTY